MNDLKFDNVDTLHLKFMYNLYKLKLWYLNTMLPEQFQQQIAL